MKLLALLTVAALAGCDAEAAPAPTVSPEQAADPVLDHQTRALAARSLGVSSLPQIQMLASDEGRRVLSTVIACALPAGTTVTAVARDGAPFQFVGRLGLAPGWADHAPTAAERLRVAACVRAQLTHLAAR